MKQKLKVEERRRVLCDAAIEILAQEGARGLTHRKVEQRVGLPDGTTSSYFGTREALLRGVALRVAELDAADFEAVMQQLSGAGPEVTILSLLAEMAMRSAGGPGLDRSRARYELAFHARRDAVLAGILQDAIAGFVTLSEQAVVQIQPGGEMDRALVEEQALAVTTFLNGVMVRHVVGDHGVDSAAKLTRLLHAIVAGVAASYHVHDGTI